MTPREGRPAARELVRRQARALGDPTRYDIFRFVAEARGAVGPYELLALMLLDIVEGERSPVEAGVDAGRAPEGCADGAHPLDVLEAEMARRGFEPRRETFGPVTELVLERCPSLAAASARPEVVCQIHRGRAAGILDGMHADEQIRDRIIHPPAAAGCRLQFERRPPAQKL